MWSARKDKRGSIFYWPYFLLVLLILFSYGLYVIFDYKKPVENTFYVGSGQQNIYLKYNELEQKNIFFEQASRLAYYDSINYLYENGGKFLYDCGQKQGYVLWKAGQIDCFVSNTEFLDSFEKVFSSNADIYTKDKISLLIAGNLDFVYLEDKVLVKSKSKLILESKDLRYEDYLYSSIDEGLPVDELIQVTYELKSYISACNYDINCFNKASSSSLFEWKIKNNGKLFMFDVNTHRKVGLFEKKDLILKFGVDFNEFNPLFR